MFKNSMDYLPAIVTFGMLFIIGIRLLVNPENNLWRKFEIGMIVIAIVALLWWAITQTGITG